MTRLLYLSPARFPSVRAHARQATEQCAGFAAAGADVTLAHPDLPPRGPVPRDVDLFEYYGLPRTFRTLRLPTADAPEVLDDGAGLGQRAWRSAALGTAALGALASILRERGPLLVYSREKHASFLAPMLRAVRRFRLLLEVHDLWRPLGRANRAWLRRADGIVVIHPALRDDLIEEGVPSERILVEPDGVREVLARAPDRDEARRELGLAPGARLVVYTGHLYPAKGADVLARAISRIPDAEGLIVGGLDADRARLEGRLRDEGISNVRTVPHVPPDRASQYQAAADVLVMPTRPLGENARRYTSPLKLAEYRAAGRPIVATDLPSTRAWLADGETALLVPPDDPGAMAAAIDRLLRDPALGRRLAATAREGLASETWRARAERILAFADVGRSGG